MNYLMDQAAEQIREEIAVAQKRLVELLRQSVDEKKLESHSKEADELDARIKKLQTELEAYKE